MKQAVKRKTLTGSWEAFTFPARGRTFTVKNLSETTALVSFLNDGVEDEAIKIAAGATEIVAISFDPIARREQLTDTVFVKGTGEIEVCSRETVRTIDDETISGDVLILSEQATVADGAVEIPSAVIDGDTLEI